jgi:hypothetical protein
VGSSKSPAGCRRGEARRGDGASSA